MSKRLRKTRLTSTKDDIHFIFKDDDSSEMTVEKDDCDQFEAREVSKHEASKPLFLVRE